MIIALLMMLATWVTGCGRAPRYDGRLVAADSLMRSNPDSALAVVEGVCRDSLAADFDRAYRDLLLTQARYRCYVTATSDSTINRALAYYRAHPSEREKLTRAYIHKGAVMEELGHPDSAMLYYKHAEATADTTDYFNLGYINLRIAVLLRRYYVDSQLCYEKYKCALQYFQLVNDKDKQQVCLYNMGVCAGITHKDNSIRLLKQALELAIELNDSVQQYDCKEMMCRQFMSKESNLSEAKKLALDCFYHYRNYINNELMIDLSDIYIKENCLDSAKKFIAIVNEEYSPDHTEQIQMRKYEILSTIANKEGKLKLYSSYCDSMTMMTENVLNNKTKYSIKQIENQENLKQTHAKKERIGSLKTAIFILSIIFLATLALMAFLLAKKHYRIKAFVREFGNGINGHEDLLLQIQDKNNEISHFVTDMVELMRSTFKASTTKKKLSSEKINENINAIKNAATDGFWNELRLYLDKRYDGIISRIETTPGMKEKDLRFVELICCRFSYAEIAIILGYSPAYISTKRNNIAKKLKLDMPLQEYIEAEMGMKR